MQFFSVTGQLLPYPSKAVCVGRNYGVHAKELNNEVPEEPIIFIKAPNSFVPMAEKIVLPVQGGECHHEIELLVQVKQKITRENITKLSFSEQIGALGLALDLTLRNRQTLLKSQGLPWERAKAFDGSCPISTLINFDGKTSLEDLQILFAINNQVRQHGFLKDLIFPIQQLIEFIVADITLEEGDLILTGTPAGVAALHSGDSYSAELKQQEQTLIKVMGQFI